LQPGKPVPDGCHSITPYLVIQEAAEVIKYYKQVFEAEERLRITIPDGNVGHTELEIGDSVIMLAGEFPEMGRKGPKTIGGSPVSIHLYVKNVDQVVEQAVSGGPILKSHVEDKFYGDRCALLPTHIWTRIACFHAY
jgi:PhnB protein